MGDSLLGTIVTKEKKFTLPNELVDIIKTYTGEGCWYKGKYINVRRIPKTDERYAMLKKRPRIKQVFNNDFENPKRGCVWFKLPSGKFIVINVMNGSLRIDNSRYECTFWEMHYNMQSETFIIH